MSDPRLIVALDFPEASAALALAARLDPARCRLKVGKELFVTAGPDLVRRLHDQGFQVFLDLKFHDIPNTVARACAAAARLGVWMVNVHAQGGRTMMEAARAAVEQAPQRPLLIAVTVLTSMDVGQATEVGMGVPIADTVTRLAQLTQSCGLDGVVCSAQEAPVLRQAISPSFRLVTPGIRPAGAAAGDQSRIATPAEAVQLGADYLVIGRPISHAADPLAALQAIYDDLGDAAWMPEEKK